MLATESLPTAGRNTNDAISDAAKNPNMNFGSLYQISVAETFVFPLPFSTLVEKKIATANAINPIRIF